MIYIINNIFQKHCVILYNNTRSLSLILNNFPNNSQTNKELEVIITSDYVFDKPKSQHHRVRAPPVSESRTP